MAKYPMERLYLGTPFLITIFDENYSQKQEIYRLLA